MPDERSVHDRLSGQDERSAPAGLSGQDERSAPAGLSVPGELSADRDWLARAIELSRRCPPRPTAFCVGAVIVAADGTELSYGYSRETGPHDHAEQTALAKLAPDDSRLVGATIYSSLEPCSERRSHPLTCVELILSTPVSRVVIGWREPPILVADPRGVELLRESGRSVLELPDLGEQVAALNPQLALPPPADQRAGSATG